MNKPTLTVGASTITMPMPSDWEVNLMIGENTQTSIGGTDYTDINYRKYEYTLIWDAIYTDDYNTLENFVNSMIDNQQEATFIFEKFPQTVSPGVSCSARLSPRKKTGGSGTSFYSKVELTLREVSAR